MQKEPTTRLLEKPVAAKRAGYSLIVVALVFFMLLTTSPSFYSPWLAGYSYVLVGLGLALVVVNRVLEWRQVNRLKNATLCCPNCGWSGNWKSWSNGECCPECDAEDVFVRNG